MVRYWYINGGASLPPSCNTFYIRPGNAIQPNYAKPIDKTIAKRLPKTLTETLYYRKLENVKCLEAWTCNFKAPEKNVTFHSQNLVFPKQLI